MAQARPQHTQPIQEETGRAARPSARAVGETTRSTDRYKIKLRSVGYRLVYEVRDQVLLVVVIAVGKREHDDVYRQADKR
jgi:mRNA interferase RelE/StbE